MADKPENDETTDEVEDLTPEGETAEKVKGGVKTQKWE